MNSIGLQETQPRRFENMVCGFEGSESSPVDAGAETITIRVHVHNETPSVTSNKTSTVTSLTDVAKPFEHNAKTAATVADMIDQREFNQTIS
jgi:hypothetical protein